MGLLDYSTTLAALAQALSLQLWGDRRHPVRASLSEETFPGSGVSTREVSLRS
jgi:hypothetical protein